MGVSAIKFPKTDTFRAFQSAVEGQQASFGPWGLEHQRLRVAR